MKREIKFRGINNHGVWIYGSLVYSKNIQAAIYFEVGQGAVKHFDFSYVDKKSVGQYTGLKDTKGIEIYEGDIIKATYRDGENDIDGFFEVIYDEGAFSAKVDTNYAPCLYELWGKVVIGNIYDNSELLK